MRHNMKRIQSKLHTTGTYNVCKISLSCFYDKRYILDDDINSLAHFHRDVNGSRTIPPWTIAPRTITPN